MDEVPLPIREMLAQQVSLSIAAALDQVIYTALRRHTGEVLHDVSQLAGRLSRVKRAGTDGETYHLDGTPFLWVSDVRIEDSGGVQNVSFDHRMLPEVRV